MAEITDGSCVERSTVLPSTLRITSPVLMPAFSAGPPSMTWPTSAPRGRSRPKASANCAFTSWICTPMRPRVTLPVLDELLAHVVGHVDRDGERQAHVAAAAAVDLRVDADHFAVEIEQRAAGVARIHRHVGLDERHETVFARHGATGGADDARGHAVLERERRTDGEHPFTRTQLRRIADASPPGRFLPSILMTATSVRSSTPMTLAGYSRRSVMRTVTSSASATTCALVRM